MEYTLPCSRGHTLDKLLDIFIQFCAGTFVLKGIVENNMHCKIKFKKISCSFHNDFLSMQR